MSTTTVIWKLDKNSVANDMAVVALQDPTNTFGVIRKDTNAVVVPAGTPLVRLSLGVYEYTFTDPVQGLEYRYYVRVEIDGDVIYYERDYSKPAPEDTDLGLTSRYSSSERLYNKFGQDNILRWATYADSEPQDIIDERIQHVLDDADAYVDDRIRGGPYVLPFCYPIPPAIADIACTMAGIELYSARGLEDFEDGNRLTVMGRESIIALSNIQSGRLQLAPITGFNHLNVVGCED